MWSECPVDLSVFVTRKSLSFQVCGRAFTTKGNLKVHTGTHMYHTQTSPTMVPSAVTSGRQRRRYDFHPYSVHVSDMDRSLTSSPSSTIIKSESWWTNDIVHYFTPVFHIQKQMRWWECIPSFFFVLLFGALVLRLLFLTQVSVLLLVVVSVCVQPLANFLFFLSFFCEPWKEFALLLQLRLEIHRSLTTNRKETNTRWLKQMGTCFLTLALHSFLDD